MPVSVVTRTGFAFTAGAVIPRPSDPTLAAAWDAAVLHCEPADPERRYIGPEGYSDATTPYSPAALSPATSWGNFTSAELSADTSARHAEAAAWFTRVIGEFTRARDAGRLGHLRAYARPADGDTSVAFMLAAGESRLYRAWASTHPTGDRYVDRAPVPPSLRASFTASDPDAVLWGRDVPLPRFTGGPDDGSVIPGYVSGEVFDTHTLSGGGTGGVPHRFTTHAARGERSGFYQWFAQPIYGAAGLVNGAWQRIFPVSEPDVAALPFLTSGASSGAVVLAPAPGGATPGGRGDGFDPGSMWRVCVVA